MNDHKGTVVVGIAVMVAFLIVAWVLTGIQGQCINLHIRHDIPMERDVCWLPFGTG